MKMNEFLPMLAIETTGEICSAALLVNPGNILELNVFEKHSHSEKLLISIEKLLETAGLKTASLKSIAISEGPGSFTGLRIGFSAAKAIAFSLEIPIIPVPTFDATASQIMTYLSENTEFGIVSRVNREELYLKQFVKRKGTVEELTDISLINIEKVESNFPHKILFCDSTLNGVIKVPHITAGSIAEFAYLFGEHLLNYNFDYIEPRYFKNFTVRTM